MTEKMTAAEKAEAKADRAEAKAEEAALKAAAKDSRERGFTVPDEDLK